MAAISTSTSFGTRKDSSMTECERILNRITKGDSDIDLSEEESEKRIAETGEDDAVEEQDEFDQDAKPEKVEEDTEPVFMPVLEECRIADDGALMSHRDWSTRQDFQQCIDQKLRICPSSPSNAWYLIQEAA
ncbi:hypothetical protein CRENBAI_016404 [Crenichthys baileyi]|uniref:Uncharacterized protein n=1 Tax=Crenichthys baileyi TaxID=28760 RepID=A0AAV9QX95_9TELE